MPGPAHTLAQWLDELGRITDEPGRLTRTFLSPAMRRANHTVAGWMHQAGLTTRSDSVGNGIGRLECDLPGAKTLLLGSHLDTVRDAGRFDGALGVLLPIVVLHELRRRGMRLPFAVEVIGFSEEEGVRFGSAYLGSSGYAGRLKAGTLKLRDAAGVSVREAIEEWNGGAFAPPRPAHRRNELLGYVEVHIEQGRVLESLDLAVGVVSAIAGQSRFRLTWTGKTGHAGTTPMALRRDALAGAAEFIARTEKLARKTDRLVATVGSLSVSPNAANVVPGTVVHSLDVRHPHDGVRRSVIDHLRVLAKGAAGRRQLACSWDEFQDDDAVTCSPELSTVLARSVESVQGRNRSLVSGAGHDAVVMASMCPVAMLFVRCRDGLSHHPDEFVRRAELGVAVRVMLDFFRRMAEWHA